MKNIAIVGYGNIAKKHISALLRSNEKFKIYVISKRKHKSKSRNVFFFKSLKSIDKIKISLAVICSAAPLHIKQCKYFFKKKTNIFIEKPMSSNLFFAKSIAKDINKHKKLFRVGYVLRYLNSALKIKKILKKKLIGKIIDVQIQCSSFLPNWRTNRDYKKTVSSNRKLGGGVLLELSHEIDYIIWLFGYPTKVFADMSKKNVFNINVEEAVQIFFQMKRFKISANINFNKMHEESRFCKIYGTKGTLMWNIKDDKIEIIKKNKVIKKNIFSSDPFKAQIKEILKNINTTKKNKKIFNESLSILRLINYIKKSNKYGKLVKVS